MKKKLFYDVIRSTSSTKEHAGRNIKGIHIDDASLDKILHD